MTVVRGDAARRLIARTRSRHVEHRSSGTDPVWTASTTVLSGPDGAALVHSFVRDQLVRHEMDVGGEDSLLVVNELVANALRHGRGPVALRLSRLRHGPLSVEVSDTSPPTPALQAASDRHRAAGRHHPAARAEPDSTEPGRGLEIVGLLSSSWGVRVHAGGKCVWALLDQDTP